MAKARSKAKLSPAGEAKREPLHFLKQWRYARGYRQQQRLADLAGYSRHSIISRLETGVQPMDDTHLRRLTIALRLSNPGDLYRPPSDRVWSLASKLASLSKEKLDGIEAMLEAWSNDDSDKG